MLELGGLGGSSVLELGAGAVRDRARAVPFDRPRAVVDRVFAGFAGGSPYSSVGGSSVLELGAGAAALAVLAGASRFANLPPAPRG